MLGIESLLSFFEFLGVDVEVKGSKLHLAVVSDAICNNDFGLWFSKIRNKILDQRVQCKSCMFIKPFEFSTIECCVVLLKFVSCFG